MSQGRVPLSQTEVRKTLPSGMTVARVEVSTDEDRCGISAGRAQRSHVQPRAPRLLLLISKVIMYGRSRAGLIGVAGPAANE